MQIIISFLCSDKVSNMQKILLLLFFIPIFSLAQDKSLLVEGVSPNLYINHTVAAKENYYSIGRIYNVSPKEIAPFNRLDLEAGLSLGQHIKVPVGSSFFQSGTAAPDETFVPVYYAVKESEGLFRVAKDRNDLPLETLKQWNNITGDAVSKGAVLLVGYLKVKKDLSYLANNGVGSRIGSNTVAATKAEVKTVEVEKQPAVKKVAEPVTVATPKKVEEVEVKAVVTEKPMAAKKEVAKPIVKETEKVVETKAASKQTKNLAAGVFKSSYDNQFNTGDDKGEEAVGGIFKSTSGWVDRRYYCLHNQAASGSIIKVTNPANGKVIYAKVLDIIPDIRQNEGMHIIISNAAADELGVTENNFACKLSFVK